MRRVAMMVLALAGAEAAGAQPSLMGPVVPAPVRPRECQRPGPDAEQGEMVVCGRRPDENSPYRIPRALRQRQNVIEDRDMSWDARTRDMEALERFSSANVGPSGMSQNARRRDCEWRAARQIAQGRQPDCGRRDRRDTATDWRRR